MPIDDDDDITIHSGQAKAGEFYANANTFFKEEDQYEEMSYEEYFDLKGGAEELEYVPLSMHLTDTDEQFYLPQYVDFILLSVIDSKSIIDSCASAIPCAIVVTTMPLKEKVKHANKKDMRTCGFLTLGLRPILHTTLTCLSSTNPMQSHAILK